MTDIRIKVSEKCDQCDGRGWLCAREADPKGYHGRAMAGYSDDTKYACNPCGSTGRADREITIEKLREMMSVDMTYGRTPSGTQPTRADPPAMCLCCGATLATPNTPCPKCTRIT